MFHQDKEYLSESHKQHSAIRKTRFWARVGAFFAGCVVFWLLYSASSPLLYSAEDRSMLKTIKEYRQRAQQVISDPYERGRYLALLREREKQIKGRYSMPSLWGLFSYKGSRKPLFVFLWFLPLFLATGLYLALKKRFFREWDRFFLPSPQKERPLSVPQKVPRLWGEHSLEKELFSSAVDFKRVFAYAEGLPEEQVAKEMETLLKDIEKFLKDFYPGIDMRKTLFCFQVVLWHYCGSLYANLPVGLLSRHVKDYPLKKLLSLYSRNHLPTFVDVNGSFQEQEYDAYVLCRLFYECDEVLSLRERLNKFNPLPFELNY